MRRVEWMGLRLPSSDPIVSFEKLTHNLTKRSLHAIEEMDAACVSLVRIDGGTEFGLGTKDGLSKNYLWCPQNRYVEQMSDSDAYILFHRIMDEFQFKDLDDPRHRSRIATYPPPIYMAKLIAMRHGVIHRPGELAASKVARLLRAARSRERGGEQAKVIGQRIGRWGPKP